MTLALRSDAIVDNNHAITMQAPELSPGMRVEVIVLVETETEIEKNNVHSFLNAIVSSEKQSGISRTQLYHQAAQLIGKFSDIEGATNLAVEHDRYLDESGQ